jgi:hypothetical protein
VALLTSTAANEAAAYSMARMTRIFFSMGFSPTGCVAPGADRPVGF